MLRVLQLLAALAVCSGEALLHAPDGVNQPDHPSAGAKAPAKTAQLAKRQMKDSHFWQPTGETYSNHAGRFFQPSKSSTFSLIKLDNVNVTFLDNTNLRGYDGADMATLGKYGVMTRMGMIEHCNSRNFDDVDGILGFGWADQPRSAALLKTLTQRDRPSWNMFDQPFRGDHAPMPRKFTFTANYEVGELQLGGYDPRMLAADFTMFDMVGENVYGIPVHSITYGGVELLHFANTNHKKVFTGEFDSGTTCLLLPNSDVSGNFTTSPFGILAREQAKGERHPLLYKVRDIYGEEHTYAMAYTECVEPTDDTMIMGDPFFRKWVVLHDLTDLSHKKMGLAPKNPAYQLATTTDESILTPGHAPVPSLSNPHGVHKIHARRKMRDRAFVESLHQVRKQLTARTELVGETVDKVAIKAQQMVTYNVQLAIGSPPQPLDVIFDTGSFMLAVFADPPPKGMKPLLKEDKKDAKKKTGPAARRATRKTAAPTRGRATAKSAKADLVTDEELAMTAWALRAKSQSYMSGAPMAAAVSVCCAALVAALVVMTRRRASSSAPLVPHASTYGTV
jgi:hypothetical protein